MPTERSFCESCGFLYTDPRHFRSGHMSRRDWPRWMFVTGGHVGMTEEELDELGAPQTAHRNGPAPEHLATASPPITAPISLICGLDGCTYTTPFESKNHDSALRLHRMKAKQHKAVPVG